MELVTAPTRDDIYKLLDVDQFKSAKRITHSREDAFIRDCILDAWAYIDGPEAFCRRAVLPQTWRFNAVKFPENAWLFPAQTARGIVSIKYWNSSNVETTIAPADYYLRPHGDNLGSSLHFVSGYSVPTLYDRFDALTVEYTAGWPDALKVPRVFRRALQLVAAHFYDNREATYSDPRMTKVSRNIELGVDALLSRHVIPLDYSGRR